MEILNIQILNGPNYRSINHKIAEITLDVGSNEELAAKKINDFYEDFKRTLTEFNEHLNWFERPGGLFEKIKTGTLLGHLVEYTALILQSMAGMKCEFGRTIKLDDARKYKIIFAFEEEKAAVYAANASVKIVDSLCNGQKYDLRKDVLILKKIASDNRLGISTSSIVEAAISRNIPVKRLKPGAIVQLGYGSSQKRIESTFTDNTSCIAVNLASDKYQTKSLLKSENIPVPKGCIITEVSELKHAVDTFGFPLVVRPNSPTRGKAVTLNIKTPEQAVEAFNSARSFDDKILIEKFYHGNSYKLLVINYKLVAGTRTTPPIVAGNGILTVRELINLANNDLANGKSQENILTRICIDQETEECLKLQGTNLNLVLPEGKKVFVKQVADLNNGGTSEDVTEIIHPEVAAMAERVSRIIGLDICGIDYISDNISQPLKRANGVVIGVNASPEFRMHTHPFRGKSRNIGEMVVKMLFPEKNDGRIPLIAVTGTSGKTITTRLIAHIARTAGYNVGFTTSDGAYVGGHLIEEGDCTGAASAEKILGDKNVDFAVLECNREGLLHTGVSFDRCDIGVITNIEDDHLGMDDIYSLEELAEVKSVIPGTVKPDGVAILNADNPHTCKLKNTLKCNVALFSSDVSNCALEHCSKGGTVAIYKDGKVLLVKNNIIFFSESIENIPLSFGGRANFMIDNILAAFLSAYFKGIDVEIIRKALRTFTPSFENLPGRANFFQFKNIRILLDNAHNAYEIASLGSWLTQEYPCYKTAIISSQGDRRDIDIMNVGKASAEIFDKIIIRVDEKPKERTDKEIIDLLCSGVKSSNKNLQMEIIKSEEEAVIYALKNSKPGSLIVLFSDNVYNSHGVIRTLKQKEEEYSGKQYTRVTDLR